MEGDTAISHLHPHLQDTPTMEGHSNPKKRWENDHAGWNGEHRGQCKSPQVSKQSFSINTLMRCTPKDGLWDSHHTPSPLWGPKGAQPPALPGSAECSNNVLPSPTAIQFLLLNALSGQNRAYSPGFKRCSLTPFCSHKGIRKKKMWIVLIIQKSQSSQASSTSHPWEAKQHRLITC